SSQATSAAAIVLRPYWATIPGVVSRWQRTHSLLLRARAFTCVSPVTSWPIAIMISAKPRTTAMATTPMIRILQVRKRLLSSGGLRASLSLMSHSSFEYGTSADGEARVALEAVKEANAAESLPAYRRSLQGSIEITLK